MSGGAGAVSGSAFLADRNPLIEHGSGVGPAFHNFWEIRVFMTAERAAVPQARWLFQTVLSVGALPTATPCARLHARHVLSDWGLRDQVDTIELIVSELVTNAVQASLTPDGQPLYIGNGGLDCVSLRLSSDRISTLVEVWDHHLGIPDPTLPDADDESGRGLLIVATR